MDIQDILSALREERDRLELAIAALGGNGHRRGRGPGRQAKNLRGSEI